MSNRFKVPKRLRFFLGHLAISFLIALIVIGIIFFIWYPFPLAKAVGVTHIFLMMLAIDVIVGPVLGLLVYKDGKKTLKFDLSVIISLQIAALCYGIYSIEQGRPVWLVYNVDRFELIRKNELLESNVQQAKIQFQQPSWLKPRYAAIEVSRNTEQRNDDTLTEIFAGISIAQHPERYVDVSQAKVKIQERALGWEELEKYNSNIEVEKTLTQYPQANAWVPLQASAMDMVVLLDKNNAKVIKIVDLRPWK